MSGAQVRIEGLDRMIRKVMGLAEGKRTRAAVKQAGEMVQRALREYPAERHGAAILSRDKEKRLRQLRAIFAKRANGEIPYKRTRRLARGWTYDYRSARDGMSASISNDVRYAHWVMSDQRQTMYHRLTGWRTVGQVLDQMEAKVVTVVLEAIEETIKRD